MDWDYKKRTDCRICNGKNLEIVLSLVATPPEDAYLFEDKKDQTKKRYPVDVALCHDCGLLQLTDIINPEIIYRNYIYQTNHSLDLDKHFDDYAKTVIQKIKPEKKQLVMDIGSNNGFLLYSFKKRGMKVLGVDPAKEIARTATENGIETIPNFFNAQLAEEIKKDYGQAGIITANMVFANLDNIHDTIQGVKKILNPSGVFIVETGYVRDMIQGNIIDNITHEHLSYFGVKPLQTLFELNNMQVIDVESVNTKGGSIRCYAQLSNGPHKISKSVSSFVESEKLLGYSRSEVYKAFKFRVDRVKEEMLTKLDEIKKKEKSIAGFGAACPVTTMIYNFELQDFLEFLVDDNAERHGRFCPGLNLQVFHPNKIKKEKIDYTIILPWRYSEPIMKKHRDYMKKGGHFINIPLNSNLIITPPEN